MDRYVKAVTIFLTFFILIVKYSTSISVGESESAEAHERFVVSELEEAEQVFHLISSKYERSLFVSIRNNMAESRGSTATVISDCYAYSNSGQLLSPLGASPMTPTITTIYWMNLVYFIPSIGTVDCNLTAPDGNSRTLTMYDDNNIELSYLSIRWSIDERGFSLYNPVSENFDLYKTW